MKLFGTILLIAATSVLASAPVLAQETSVKPTELDWSRGFVPIDRGSIIEFVPDPSEAPTTVDSPASKVLKDLQAVRKAERAARATCYAFLADHPISLEDARRTQRKATLRTLANNVTQAVMLTLTSGVYTLYAKNLQPTPAEQDARAIVRCNKLLNPS